MQSERILCFFFFNDPATPEIYPLSPPDALPIFRTTPVAAQGRTLKLADIAEVKRGYEDPATFLIRNNGEPTLLLGVVMREGWNGLDLGSALEAEDRKSTRLNSSHGYISYAAFCL